MKTKKLNRILSPLFQEIPAKGSEFSLAYTLKPNVTFKQKHTILRWLTTLQSTARN